MSLGRLQGLCKDDWPRVQRCPQRSNVPARLHTVRGADALRNAWLIPKLRGGQHEASRPIRSLNRTPIPALAILAPVT